MRPKPVREFLEDEDIEGTEFDLPKFEKIVKKTPKDPEAKHISRDKKRLKKKVRYQKDTEE